MKNTILLELNELNVDLIQNYIEAGYVLPNLSTLIKNGVRKTSSEKKYELVEPWIQWVSVHTQLDFEEHGVFRLGDIVYSDVQQIFEKIEAKGYTVGCLSPMNAKNNLKRPAFFIPDPWTKTPTDGSWYSQFLWKALEQSVNDNASGRVTLLTYLRLALASIYLIRLKSIPRILRKFSSMRKTKYGKAIFLDILLFYIFDGLINRKKPHFATLFLNAGAHIQHHYLYCSQMLGKRPFVNPDWYIDPGLDPVLEIYTQYDEMLGHLMSKDEYQLVIATGLSQIPFDEPVFYYRLKDHQDFLNLLGLKYKSVTPRMTRDFLINFENDEDRNNAAELLNSILLNSDNLFGEIEKREASLFVTMTYSKEINETCVIRNPVLYENICMRDHVVFVALKNGHHSQTGYLLSNNKELLEKFDSGSHVQTIGHLVNDIFPDVVQS